MKKNLRMKLIDKTEKAAMNVDAPSNLKQMVAREVDHQIRYENMKTQWHKSIDVN